MGIGKAVGQPELDQGADNQRPSNRCDGIQYLPATMVWYPFEKVFKQYRIGQYSAQYRNGGHRLHDTVSHRDKVTPDQLFDIAVLCRRIDSRLDCQEKCHRKCQLEHSQIVACRNDEGNDDGDTRCDTHHQTLGITIGNETRRGKEKNKGEQDQRIDDGSQNDLCFTVIDFEYSILDDDLVPQVGKGIEKDNDDIGKKPFDLPDTRFHSPSLLTNNQNQMSYPGGSLRPDCAAASKPYR